MLSPVCLEYDFDGWPILAYCTFNLLLLIPVNTVKFCSSFGVPQSAILGPFNYLFITFEKIVVIVDGIQDKLITIAL